MRLPNQRLAVFLGGAVGIWPADTTLRGPQGTVWFFGGGGGRGCWRSQWWAYLLQELSSRASEAGPGLSFFT